MTGGSVASKRGEAAANRQDEAAVEPDAREGAIGAARSIEFVDPPANGDVFAQWYGFNGYGIDRLDIEAGARAAVHAGAVVAHIAHERLGGEKGETALCE